MNICLINYYPYDTAFVKGHFLVLKEELVKELRIELHRQRSSLFLDNKETFEFMDENDNEVCVSFYDGKAYFGKSIRKMTNE